MMPEPKLFDKSEALWLDWAKTIRTSIRLKHSLAADREIRATLSVEWKKIEAALQRGQMPDPPGILCDHSKGKK